MTLFLVSALPAFGANSAPTATLQAPATVQPGVTTAVTLKLPANVAAVEGRLFVNRQAVEFVGVAPRGGGQVLAPTDTGSAYAFGAYGLHAVHGSTTLDLALYTTTVAQITVRVAIDAAANQNGQRIVLTNSPIQTTLAVGNSKRVIAAPFGASSGSISRTAQPARKLAGPGRIDREDVDAVRGDWYSNHARGLVCGSGVGNKDANNDGCLDVVDLQTELAAQGASTANSVSTSPSAAPLAIGDPIVHTFVVNSTADTPDAANGDGICADSLGRCTLRAAMTEADWLNGNDRITFALVGVAPVTIQLSTQLPDISSRNGTLEIDGYTQPGSSVNTATSGSNAVPGVEIKGFGTGIEHMVFYITSAGNTIRGLVIDNAYRGIFLDGTDAHDNKIIGNFIGFNRDLSPQPSGGDAGVLQNYGANHNLIGTPALADRNVIGNSRVGEDLVGLGTDFNMTQNNDFCMRPNGTTTATCQTGIDHNFGPKNNLVGGSGTNEGNVFGATTLQGVELSHGFDPGPSHDYNSTYELRNNQIIGNWIGFRGDGSYNASFRSGLTFSTADNGNAINVYDGSDNNLVQDNYIASAWDGIQVGIYSRYAVGNIVRHNTIGISPLGQAAPLGRWGVVTRGNVNHNIFDSNVIANAAAGGFGLLNADNNGTPQIPAYNTRITKNIITNTNGPAIDLYGPAGGGGAGPDPNDPGDVDTGANTQLNTPLFTTATTTMVSGTAYSGTTVELYQASRPVGQFGLPIAYLGSTTTAGNGVWSMPVQLAAGTIITALQIRPDDTTSELAANVAVTTGAPNQPPVFSTDFGDRTDAEGAPISFDADASDPDGNTLTYSATNLPSGITINSSSGVVSGTFDFSSAGTYNVTLSVSDGALSDTDTFTWTVTNTNQPPHFSTNFGDRTDTEGTAINFDANATDPDGDALTYSATNLPDGIAIDSTTGVVSGTLSATSAGTYNVTLSVSDGTLGDTDTFTWTVNEPSAVTVYVDDSFGRTTSNGWGSAPTGGAYTISGTAANFSVAGGVGVMVAPNAGALRSALIGPSVADVDVSFS
ncbi:MAG TPA: putative Ig domain-containing protein, partial [Candidatus Limnocylindrales bacterium]